jgi:ribosome-associated protein
MADVFKLRGEQIELIQLLKATGLCGTGGEAKIVVSEGLVTVGGKTETRKRCKLIRGQRIEYNGHTIEIQ